MGAGIGNLKWPKFSELFALLHEIPLPIQFKAWAAFSASQKLHLSTLKTADIFLIMRSNKNSILALTLNIALWGGQENILQHFTSFETE